MLTLHDEEKVFYFIFNVYYSLPLVTSCLVLDSAETTEWLLWQDWATARVRISR
jgi:hypothetical protein